MNSTDTIIINFKEEFNKIKKETDNFTKFKPDLFLKNRESIRILRTILGFTSNNLSKNMGIAYSWLYNLENKKANLGEKGAIKLTEKFKDLFKKYKNVDYENTLRNFCSLNNIILQIKIPNNLNNLNNFSLEEFYEMYKFIKKETDNFSYFPPYLILEDSRIITVIRIILGLSQKEFSRKLNLGIMTIEELENGYRRIKRPITAKIYSDLLNKLFKDIRYTENCKILEENWKKWKNTRKINDEKNLKWKTIRNMNTEDFTEYFNMAKLLTSNFSDFNPEIFQKTPQMILIFRIILGLTQRDLERKLSLKGRQISNYESRTYKTLSIGKSELFADFFRDKFKNLKDISEEFAATKFLECKEAIFYHKNLHLKSLKHMKQTPQEKRISNILSEIKSIKTDINSNVNTNKGIINVDFNILSDNKPKILIEATTFNNIKGRKFGYNSKRKILETDYRFIKAKKAYSNIVAILAIECDKDPLIEHKIKRIVKEETIAINKIFINDEIEGLKQFIGGIND
ncbi:MAG: helix-turn-helix transcriptional regulator [Nanoarchaeota archaeon]|nr:helix-turn-helix transcriptional regulator [Nanoarchaeota archaeon]MBU0962875.1 helix-turn-helix transcriptional regulator [Nanoarchaeota archaeon]